MKTFAAVVFLLLCSALSGRSEMSSSEGPNDPKELEAFVDGIVQKEMEQQHIPGAAFVFVKDGKVVLAKGYGYSNLERKQPVIPAKTLFRIGSISKVFTATAVMQLADRGRIDLGADVNRYLKKVQVPATFSAPIRGWNLLTHTEGLDEIRPGTQAPDAASVLPLAEFLRPRLMRIWKPGKILKYSTYASTLAGLLLEDVSGLSYEAYLAKDIWRPLGMERTCITVPANLLDDVAVGYEYVNGVNQPQRYEWYHTTPASSINSTVLDVAHFMIAHLQDGRFGDTRILSERAARQMHRQHFTMHPHVPGIAYGFWEDIFGDEHILEHGGNMAGFSAQMVLLPERKAGFFFVSQHEGSNLRDTLKWALLERFYPARQPSPAPRPSPEFVSRAAPFVGIYRWNCYRHTVTTPAQGGTTITVQSNPDGTLTIAGRKWIETEPLLFVREDGKGRIAFRADDTGRITHLSSGGFWVFEKVP